MSDCKNCQYTDEYCASGDCERNADVSKTLTEQWKKGELPVGEYYLLYTDGTTDREYYDWANVYGKVVEKGFSTDPNDIEQVLTPVPSYDEWKYKCEICEMFAEANQSLRKKLDMEKCKNKRSYYDGSPMDFLAECERDRKQNVQLKDLLKEIRLMMSIERDFASGHFEKSKLTELLTKIDEVLK